MSRTFFPRSCLLCFLLIAGCIAGSSRAQEPVVPAAPSLRILFVGDILFEASWQTNPPAAASLFARVKEILHGADLVIGNLEEPLTDHPTRTPHKNPDAVARGEDFIFRATAPGIAAAMKEAGLDVATLANNHTMDYGEQGLFDTLEQLEDAGIVSVGGGRTLREADRIRVLPLQGVRVGIVSLSDVVPRYYWATGDRPGISPAKYIRRVREVVSRARPHADVLLVVFHWGPMFTSVPTPRQQRWARVAREAGADVVLGAHPHVLQGIGCVDGAPVVYSAGNFIFPTSNPKARRSAIFELQLTGAEVEAVRVIPIQLDGEGRPAPARAQSAESILKEMETLSRDLGANFSDGSARCPR